MKISVGLYGTSAHQIALALIQGFNKHYTLFRACLLYTSPSPRD